MGNTSGKSIQQRSRTRKTVHWKAADRPSPPGRPELVSSPTYLDPDVVTLRWTRPINDGGSPIIGYIVEHKRTGSPHWVRATPGLVGKPELSISGLEPGWRYQFRVIANNAIDCSDPSELSEPLTVTLQRNIITAPRFITELKDTVALENEKIEFMVEMTGIPAPTVCWYKDGFEIFSSRRTRILTENGQSVLVIHQTALVDEGEIKCTATNKAGYVTSKANLKVEALPRIRLPRQYEDGLLFELDEMIRLKVTIAGNPIPEIFWSHNGEPIANDPRYEISTIDRTSTLRVSHAKRIDRGEYQIRAVNKLGDHTASFLVTVTDRPTPPKNIKVMSLGKSVTLTWSIPEDDGGCKIGNYIIEYYRIGWNVWLKAGTSRKLSTTLGELIEGSEYKFRLKAENPYGISDPSEESDTIFIPDPKRGLLQPPLRSKSQPRDIINNFDQAKGPIVQQSRSVTSSISSLGSRPTSPATVNEPVRPVRGQKMKTPSLTPDPSPITKRRDFHNADVNNMFDRSSVVRELTYGSPTTPARTKPFVNQARRSISPKPEIKIEDKSVSEEKKPVNKFQAIFTEQNPKPHLDSPKDDDILHGSSEFMLVLLPNTDNSTKNHRGGSESNMFNFDDAVAPPMSLSAPELGFEPPFLGSLRYAVSSSELLHERAMMRFYEATQNEQAEKIKSAVRNLTIANDFDTESNASRRCSFDIANTPEIPGIPTIRIESDEAEMLDRKHSLRRRLSGSGISQQMLWQRRLSWNAQHKNSTENNEETVEKKSVSETKSEANKRHSPTPENAKLKLGLIRQRSESEEMEEQVFEQVRAKMAKQSSFEEKKNINVAPEDKWEDEVVVEDQQELHEEDMDEEIEEEEVEEEEDDELSEDDKPWLDEDIIPAHVKVEEEETYHPKIMLPRLTIPNKEDVPFQILNKPSPLPDPNFIPKPILKKKEIDLNTEKQTEEKKTIPPKPEKPQRKSLPIKETSGKILKNITGSFNQLRNKLPSKLSDSGWSEQIEVSQEETKAQPLIIISAAEAAQRKRLESKRNSLEETKVVIDHYTDIVREYGQPKKPSVPLYLNTEALKKAAELQQQQHQQQESKLTQKIKTIIPKENQKIEPKLKKLSHKIDSSDESLSSKVSSRKFNSSEESIDSNIKQIKPKKIESSKELLHFKSRTRPLQLTETKKPYISSKYVKEQLDSCESSKSNLSTDEKILEAEIKVRTTMDYLTDIAMFLVACWLYLFHDARLAIPVLILMIYRQLSEELSKIWPSWLKKKK